jgi:hypothetical protein
MRRHLRSLRSLGIAIVIAAVIAGANVATILADGGGVPFPR